MKIRMIWYRQFFDIGKDSNVLRKCTFRQMENIIIGVNTNINQSCMLDSRGGILKIGNHVNIAPEVNIWTLQHDHNSPDFRTSGGAVTIGDFAWIANRAIILPNVTIGEGAVVAAGAVVTKNVASWTVVGGIPAKPIGQRKHTDTPPAVYKPILM